jgi:hypothetical protein
MTNERLENIKNELLREAIGNYLTPAIRIIKGHPELFPKSFDDIITKAYYGIPFNNELEIFMGRWMNSDSEEDRYMRIEYLMGYICNHIWNYVSNVFDWNSSYEGSAYSIIEKLIKYLKKYRNIIAFVKDLNGNYVDSESKYFDGTLLIIDPFHVVKENYIAYNSNEWDSFNSYLEWSKEHQNDWSKCELGTKMNNLGIKTFLTHDTLCGMSKYRLYTDSYLNDKGEFDSTSGLLSVFLLEEVLKYNSEYDKHNTGSSIIVKDFKGTVQIIIDCQNYYDEIHSENRFKFEVKIVGTGINKKTGKPTNFITRRAIDG